MNSGLSQIAGKDLLRKDHSRRIFLSRTLKVRDYGRFGDGIVSIASVREIARVYVFFCAGKSNKTRHCLCTWEDSGPRGCDLWMTMDFACHLGHDGSGENQRDTS